MRNKKEEYSDGERRRNRKMSRRILSRMRLENVSMAINNSSEEDLFRSDAGQRRSPDGGMDGGGRRPSEDQ